MGLEFKVTKPIYDESVAIEDWHDPKWQLRFSLKNKEDFAHYFKLSEQEERAFAEGSQFNVQTTPYYASLAKDHPEDPIRKIFMPNALELEDQFQRMLDPLDENNNRPSQRIIHRYPDRCLFLVTDYCNVYCRYCTRKHFTGKEQVFPKKDEYQAGLDYIKNTPKIREVILSGGDPLSLSDNRLEQVLKDLREIPHVEIIRIGSRIPVVNPFRITEDLARLLKRYKPVYLMTHFNHPREITKESAEALERIVDHGTPVFNQMVLLNGVNNHPAIIQALSRRLLYLRVKPYYMFQCDPSEGSDYLRTSIEDSLEIQEQLWGKVSGLMMPNYSIDIPGGGGKTSMVPNHQICQEGNTRTFKGFDGKIRQYISPSKQYIKKPMDIESYQQEWELLNS
ncbi:MAG: KamA family radical SAM protein [Bdellovibrionota bacterium]|nr:KamA family radical SAM protein [Bdellovibrionota bacterium]